MLYPQDGDRIVAVHLWRYFTLYVAWSECWAHWRVVRLNSKCAALAADSCGRKEPCVLYGGSRPPTGMGTFEGWRCDFLPGDFGHLLTLGTLRDDSFYRDYRTHQGRWNTVRKLPSKRPNTHMKTGEWCSLRCFMHTIRRLRRRVFPVPVLSFWRGKQTNRCRCGSCVQPSGRAGDGLASCLSCCRRQRNGQSNH